MKPLVIEATDKTPLVILNPEKGRFEISGKSVPNDAEAFYRPILDWMDAYSIRPSTDHMVIRFHLEFFNISSSKRILFILYRLNEMIEQGQKVNVKWYYRESDDDMLEVGQDYAFMVKVPFEFIAASHTDNFLSVA